MLNRPLHSSTSRANRLLAHHAIIALDLDCFYASVAILSRPHLREKPVAVVQKHLCVTTNYIARKKENGSVQKMTPVADALRACPSLQLVDGSDLSPFRAASRHILTSTRTFLSARVAEVLATPATPPFHVPVQRHGLDELFIDVSNLVGCIVDLHQAPWRFDGHLFGATDDDTQRRFLMVASQLAFQLRHYLKAATGLTLCAGVSSTKLLAKLAVNMHKPHDQTIFLPSFAADYISALPPRHLMGFGATADSRLCAWAAANAESVTTAADVVRLFGGSQEASDRLASIVKGAVSPLKILSLCRGHDDSPVIDEGNAPKSLSVEDSCRDCKSMTAVREKVAVLAHRLSKLLHEDAILFGRRACTLSVGFRFRNDGYKSTWRRFPMPADVYVNSVTPAQSDQVQVVEDAVAQNMLSTLKEKGNVSETRTFEITLIGVGASNFLDKKASAIASKGIYPSFFSSNSEKDEQIVAVKKEDAKRKKKSQLVSPVCSAIPKSDFSCPICGICLPANNLQLNRHIDLCVGKEDNERNEKAPKRAKHSPTSSQTRRVDSFFKKR